MATKQNTLTSLWGQVPGQSTSADNQTPTPSKSTSEIVTAKATAKKEKMSGSEKYPILDDIEPTATINAADSVGINHAVDPAANGHAVSDSSVNKASDVTTTLSVSEVSDGSGGVEIEQDDLEQDFKSRTTDLETLMHLLKGMVGTGILAMPVGFKNGGLWVSFVCVFVFGVIATHCMYLLVFAGNELSRRTNSHHLDYAGVMQKAFETGSDSLKKLSIVARYFVNAFLLLTQFGFCCVYTVFIAQNIKQVVQHSHPDTFDDKIYILIVSACLAIYFIFFTSLKILAIFTTIANVLNLVGLVIIFVNVFQGLPDVSERPAVANFNTFPLFFGQAVFAFEGIGLVLPLHERMRDRSGFLGTPGLLQLGLTITISLYMAMGFYGYLKFGDASKGSVTLNLPGDNWLYLSVKLMFAVSLFISCGLQFYVPVNIIWPIIKKKFLKRSIDIPNVFEYVFRFILLLFICGFSVLVPHLDLLISLVGAFASSFLAFIFPPIIELVTFDTSAFVKVKDITIILIGFLGFVTGTYASVRDIIDTF